MIARLNATQSHTNRKKCKRVVMKMFPATQNWMKIFVHTQRQSPKFRTTINKLEQHWFSKSNFKESSYFVDTDSISFNFLAEWNLVHDFNIMILNDFSRSFGDYFTWAPEFKDKFNGKSNNFYSQDFSITLKYSL